METTTDRTVSRMSVCVILQGVLVCLCLVVGCVLLAVSMAAPSPVPAVDTRLGEQIMHVNYRVDLLTDRVSRIEAKLPRTGSPTGKTGEKE